jgi:hypothetical protein
MDPLLFGTGIADLIQISESSMQEECEISRSALSGGATGVTPTDSIGNPLPGPAVPVDNNPDVVTKTHCRIAGGAKTDQERLVAGQMENPDLVVVAFPIDTDVKEGDTVTIESRGLELEVVWVPDPKPTLAIDYRVLAQRNS